MKRNDYFGVATPQRDNLHQLPTRRQAPQAKERETDYSNLYGEDNYAGDEGNYVGDDNYVGDEAGFSSFRPANASSQALAAAGVGALDSTNNVITLKIENLDPNTDLDVTLFDALNNLSQTNFGNTAISIDTTTPANTTGIRVTSQGRAYGAILQDSISRPIGVRGLRMTFEGTGKSGQKAEKLTLTFTDFNGDTQSKNVYPINYFSSGQFQQDIIDHPAFEMLLSGDTGMKFKLLAGTTVTITLWVKAVHDPGRQLFGAAPLKVTKAEAPIGLQTVVVPRTGGVKPSKGR